MGETNFGLARYPPHYVHSVYIHVAVLDVATFPTYTFGSSPDRTPQSFTVLRWQAGVLAEGIVNGEKVLSLNFDNEMAFMFCSLWL